MLQWAIDPTFPNCEPYSFTGQVSGTPTFEILEYELPAGENLVVRDKIYFKQNLASDLYYRVKLVTADNKTYYSRSQLFGLEMYTRRTYMLGAEITRKELLRMRKFTGIEGYLLKRKVVGVSINSNEVDPVSGVALADNTTNQGTNFVAGYYPPIGLYYSCEKANNTRKLSELGVNEIYVQELRTIGFPSIDTYDILVDSTNDTRWLIKERQAFTIPGTSLAVVQIMEAQAIPVTDPVYKITTPKFKYT
jgi:hypothetical protein